MAMLKTLLFSAAIVTVFATVTVFADVGCKSYKFVGSYAHVDPPADIFRDGTVMHQFIFNMTLNVDGTAYQFWTGSLDYPLNSGTGSPGIGSWTCRSDGKLVVTFLSATYFPTNARVNTSDLALNSSQRSTYLFTVTNENTLTLTMLRTRNYAAADDPTNPNGGALGALSVGTTTYKRLIASDADLLVP
jgi:hypothetical protein